ncbi:hypothetical protein A4A49_05832 [Nicotiana attenuata]|uniref:Uncharacterized protein n=1 Tax=Nicotiana attenuata TaxID=49451 RepID=A0A1J6I230_NICAT|nr:hypothetical protein A4A49_05832 [Nicotiana attenuata]
MGGFSSVIDTIITTNDGSLKGIGTTDATRNRCTSWGDKIEEMEVNNDADKNAHNNDHAKHPGTVYSQTTTNPKIQETRVEALDQTIMQNTTKSITVGAGSLIETRINEGVGEATIGKEKGNGLVNPSNTAMGFSTAAAPVIW